MTYEIMGTLHEIGNIQEYSDKFKKREFVVEIIESINGNSYSNFGKFQLVNNKCEIIDKCKVGQKVRVSFNIRGNKYEKDGVTKFITNLDAWRIEIMPVEPAFVPEKDKPNEQGSPVRQTKSAVLNIPPEFTPDPNSDLPF